MFAWAGLLGLNVEKMINGDSLDFGLRVRIAERASELKDNMDDSLALKIVSRFAQSLKGGNG